jgi:hypothetical protein
LASLGGGFLVQPIQTTLLGDRSEKLVTYTALLGTGSIVLGSRVVGGGTTRSGTHIQPVHVHNSQELWISYAIMFGFIGIGAAFLLFALLIGLGVAFFPRWLCRKKQLQAQVDGRYALLSNGYEGLNEIPPADVPCQFVVRLGLQDGRTAEYLCPLEVYRHAHNGHVGQAIVQGQFLLGFHPITTGTAQLRAVPKPIPKWRKKLSKSIEDAIDPPVWQDVDF